MQARVKQDYAAGPVIAFSGREYIRSEWREVPEGFEEQAKNHPLLEVQPSLEGVRADSSGLPGLGVPEPEEAVTAALAPGASTGVTEEPAEPTPEPETKTEEPHAEAEPPAEEPKPEPRATRRRRAAED